MLNCYLQVLNKITYLQTQLAKTSSPVWLESYYLYSLAIDKISMAKVFCVPPIVWIFSPFDQIFLDYLECIQKVLPAFLSSQTTFSIIDQQWDRPQEMKAVQAQVISCCVYDKPKKYAAHEWQHSIHVCLMGRSRCSSPSTKELRWIA